MVKSKLEEFIDMDTAQVDFGKISDGTDFRYVFSIKGVNDRSMRLKTDHPRVQQTLHSLGGVVVIDSVASHQTSSTKAYICHYRKH